MKLIIAGSREGFEFEDVKKAYLDYYGNKNMSWKVSEIVSGRANGVDKLGEQLAILEGIPVKHFLPDWSKGKRAGFVRNVEMAHYADRLLAIWDKNSTGTRHMINTMLALKKPVKVYGHFGYRISLVHSSTDYGHNEIHLSLKEAIEASEVDSNITKLDFLCDNQYEHVTLHKDMVGKWIFNEKEYKNEIDRTARTAT